MAALRPRSSELRLAAKYSAVSLTGFAIDAVVLHAGLLAGIQPAWARVISLLVAMHATFLINGWQVFRCLDRSRWPAQWAAYMATNGVGNLVNYWMFVTLVSTHARLIATPMFALSVGSVCAWAINYVSARWLVFGPAMRALARRTGKWRE